MKKLTLILAATIIAGSLFSCSEFSTMQIDSGTASPDAIAGGTSDAEPKIKTKTVNFSPTSVIDNFDFASERRFSGDAPQVSFNIPDSWTGSGSAYQSFDKRTSSYTRTFEIYAPISVDGSYVMAEDMIYLYRFDKIFSKTIVNGAEMSVGETYTGYDYASFIYTNETTNVYSMIAFIRVEPEMILPCTFVLPLENAELAERCLHSVRYSASEDKEAASTDIRSYMNYFVNYIHEPMDESTDLSGSNLLYLVFMNCYSNYELYSSYGVTKTEDGGELKIPGNFARDLCKTLTGKAYDLTKYHSYFENSADSYSAEEDVYTFCLGTDYWNGDPYYVDNETEMKIKDNGSTVTVTAQVYFAAGPGEPKEQERTMEFVFEPFGMTGGMLYRIVSISKVK